MTKLRQSALCLPSSESFENDLDFLIVHTSCMSYTFLFFLCHLEAIFSTIFGQCKSQLLLQSAKG